MVISFGKRWPWQNEHIFIYPKKYCIMLSFVYIQAIYYSFRILGCVKVTCIFFGLSIRVIWGRWFRFDEQEYLRNDQQDISSMSPSWLQVKISFIITLKKYASKCLVFLGYIPPKGTCLGGTSLPLNQPMMGGRLISPHGMCLNGKLGSMLKTLMSNEQKPDCLGFFLRGWNTTQLCDVMWGFYISYTITRIPSSNNYYYP